MFELQRPQNGSTTYYGSEEKDSRGPYRAERTHTSIRMCYQIYDIFTRSTAKYVYIVMFTPE